MRKGAPLRPRHPVRPTFRPRLANLKVLTLEKPKDLPTRRVIGPLPRLPGYAAERHLADRAARLAAGPDWGAADAAFTEAYRAWAAVAEQELLDVTGAREDIKQRASGRGHSPGWCGGACCRAGTSAWMPPPRRPGVWPGCWAGPGRSDEPKGAVWRSPALPELKRRLDCRAAWLFEGSRLLQGAGALATAARARAKDLAARALTASVGNAWNQDGQHELETDFEALEEELQRESMAAAARERDSRGRLRANWAESALDGGAGRAHAFTKCTESEHITAIVSEAEAADIEPERLLPAEARKLEGIWRASPDEPDLATSDKEALGRGPAELIRQTSKLPSERSASTSDGFRVRRCSLLRDDALECLSILFEAVERQGALPGQLRFMLIVLLAKPAGGWRPIAVFCSLYRLWAKCRQSLAAAWEASAERPFFAASRGRSPTDPMWRYAVRAEAARAEGKPAAAIWRDLAKFYEHIQFEALIAAAARHNFPWVLLKVAIAAYRPIRLVHMKGGIEVVGHAGRGAPAGCVLANNHGQTVVFVISGSRHLDIPRRAAGRVHRRLPPGERGRHPRRGQGGVGAGGGGAQVGA